LAFVKAIFLKYSFKNKLLVILINYKFVAVACEKCQKLVKEFEKKRESQQKL